MKKMIYSIAAIIITIIAVYVITRCAHPYLVIEKNIEALTDAEMPSIPCVQAVSTCYFLVKNADGTVYNATVTGQRNVY